MTNHYSKEIEVYILELNSTEILEEYKFKLNINDEKQANGCEYLYNGK